VGRSLALLGKHRQAIDVYDEAQKLAGDDWELWLNKGVAFAHTDGGVDAALECFGFANAIQPNDATYIQVHLHGGCMHAGALACRCVHAGCMHAGSATTGEVHTLIRQTINPSITNQIARVHEARDELAAATAAYMEALDRSPESAELLTGLGLLLLRAGDSQRAFDYLGTSLLHDPRSARTILAIGSISQDHADHDAALVKYRVAAAAEPNCPQLWNNVGMAFFGKQVTWVAPGSSAVQGRQSSLCWLPCVLAAFCQLTQIPPPHTHKHTQKPNAPQRYIAAISCLKRALYLAPFEWLTSYNLGLAHLATGQDASAFHHLSTAVNLRPGFAHRCAWSWRVVVRCRSVCSGRTPRPFASSTLLSCPRTPLLRRWGGGLYSICPPQPNPLNQTLAPPNPKTQLHAAGRRAGAAAGPRQCARGAREGAAAGAGRAAAAPQLRWVALSTLVV
jgi:tetratricopeptide (TPR) repeat protein